MNLKKYFSVQRFYQYLKYDLVLNGKTYLFTLIGLCIVLFVVDLFNLFNLFDFYDKSKYQVVPFASKEYNVNISFFKKDYLPVFMVCLLIGLLISGGTAFSALRNSKNSATYLLLPVSNLEKYLVQFLLRIVAFTLLYFVLFWLIFKSAYLFFEFFEPLSNTIKNYDILDPLFIYQKYPYIFEVDYFEYFMFITIFLFVAIFSFAGASFYKKYALFKTIFTFAILAFTVFLLLVGFSHLFYTHGENDFFQIKCMTYDLSKDFSNKDFYLLTLFSGFSLLLLPLAYFNLKEREV